MKTSKNDKSEAQLHTTNGALAALVEYNEKIISSWLEHSGRSSAKLHRICPEYAEIEVSAGGNTRIFGLWFGKTYRSMAPKSKPKKKTLKY